ncbi:hypothetical protein WMW72_20400, partial [Paenibacillus filicis]
AGVVGAGGAPAPQAGSGVASGAPATQAGVVGASGAPAPQAGVVGAGGASAPQAGTVGAGGASAPQAGVVGASGASAPQAGTVGAGGASAPQAGVVGASGASAPQAGSPGPAAGASLPQSPPAASDGAPRATETPAPQAAQTVARPAEPQEHLLGRLMKTIGIEHEHQAVRMLGTEGGNNLLSAGAEKHADSLKSALMQLAQSADAPDDIKQAAQQAVHQITGQQLLLSADRSAIFSHITMFVPIVQSDGTQTAAIHIQSRKGKSGSLDSENCRLVFDLQMKELGNTLVDVKVVNRIVSLHVHNDLPYTQTLLESYRDEIAGGLSSIGYQFISMKVSPYPEKLGDLGDLSAAGGKELPAGAVPGVYAQKPYKGVDIRL